MAKKLTKAEQAELDSLKTKKETAMSASNDYVARAQYEVDVAIAKRDGTTIPDGTAVLVAEMRARAAVTLAKADLLEKEAEFRAKYSGEFTELADHEK